MNQELNKLISLQEIDDKIFEIESLAGNLPQRIRVKEESIENLKNKVDILETRLQELEKENKKLKIDNEDGQSKLNKYKDQLYSVKSNKEYDALNLQIDHLKGIITESEDKYISFESEKEDLFESKKEHEIELNELSDKLKSEKNQLYHALKNSKVELIKLNDDREQAEQKIDNSHLKEYRKLKKAIGAGITALNGDCCGNCYVTLPPQLIVEIKSNNIIHLCTSCGVFLFWEDKQE